jgi:catechol 2,3-dioxygenase-like lactoylglutathione lyase family enzyme
MSAFHPKHTFAACLLSTHCGQSTLARTSQVEIAMIDHLTFGVSDFDRSVRFYDRALAPLGIRRLSDDASARERTTGYGDRRPWLWIAERPTGAGPLHIGIRASSRESVDDFYGEALSTGGTDNGPPGLRPLYHAGYYAAFVLDPDGHNIEAVFHDLG